MGNCMKTFILSHGGSKGVRRTNFWHHRALTFLQKLVPCAEAATGGEFQFVDNAVEFVACAAEWASVGRSVSAGLSSKPFHSPRMRCSAYVENGTLDRTACEDYKILRDGYTVKPFEIVCDRNAETFHFSLSSIKTSIDAIQKENTA